MARRSLLALLLASASTVAIAIAIGGASTSTTTARTTTSSSATPPLRPVWWCSTDVRPNETLLCAADIDPRYVPAAAKTIRSASGALAHVATLRLLPAGKSPVVVPARISESGMAFSAVIPRGLPDVALSAQLDVDGVAVSAIFNVRAPELWWVQGDRGEAASATGWLRVFGRGLLPPAPDSHQGVGVRPSTQVQERNAEPRCERCDLADIAEKMARAGRRGDWEEVTRLSDMAHVLASDATERHWRGRAARTTLTLTDDKNHSMVLMADVRSLSSFSAQFAVPASATAGTYRVTLSNGFHDAELGYFVSASEPRRSTVEILPVPPKRLILNVSSYGATGVNLTSDLQTSVQIDSSKAVSAALNAAAVQAALYKAECAVSLPIGRTYVQGPLLLGNRVVLRGHSTSTSALYFAEHNGTGWENQSFTGCKSRWCGAPPAMISNSRPQSGPDAAAAGELVSFGLEDLTVYVLGYYNAIVNISTETSGVRLLRVRIRADAFINRDNTAARSVPWQATFGGVGRPLVLLQGNNVEISGCDMWGSWDALYAREHFPGEIHTPSHAAHFLLITNNSFSYGGQCYNLEQVQQVIMEGNTCTGQGMSQGNGIATHGGGVAQHVFLGSNTFESIWGEDREAMTFDNRGNQYFGPATSIQAEGTNLTTFGRGAAGGNGNGYDVTGGACIIVNGTGAGQYRRILSYSMPADGSGPGWFQLDSAFDTPPMLASDYHTVGAAARSASPSFLSCVPFRGRMIFHQNHFKDTGAFNFYGISVDNIVAENTAERFQGYEIWGQWRMGGMPTSKTSMRPFIQMTLRNELIGNRVLEGLTADHKEGKFINGSTSGDHSESFHTNHQMMLHGDPVSPKGLFGSPLANGAPNSFVIKATMKGCGTHGDGPLSCAGLARLITMRRNVLESNGGMQIGASTDCMVEGTWIANTPPQSLGLKDGQSPIQVSKGVVGFVARDNHVEVPSN